MTSLDLAIVNYERAWAAGFFDGEGNITCHRPKAGSKASLGLQLSVTQIHRGRPRKRLTEEDRRRYKRDWWRANRGEVA